MAKIIGLCDCTKNIQRSRLASELSIDLDNLFGNNKALRRHKSLRSSNQPSMSIDAITSSLVDTRYGHSKKHKENLAMPVPNVRTKPVTVHDTKHDKVTETPILDWSSVKALILLPSSAIEFLLTDSDFDRSFLVEAKMASLTDILVALDHHVRKVSSTLQFVETAIKQIEDCQIGVIVDLKSFDEALDICSHFEDFVRLSKSKPHRFRGHMPQTKNSNEYSALEIMALQNIALGLLNLKYEDNHLRILPEMFEGFLH
ncbi:hypothetical protein N9E48_01080 [Paracoccaceae bacterium]|nr:hypothetical protein [Paracoccaceae bacterium]